MKKRLERERPGIVDQIQTSVTDVTGTLQSKFGPISRSYFVAKRLVTTQHQQGNLNENSMSGYAQSHRFEEVTIGLSLLCALPVDVIERALADKNREMLLVLAKSLEADAWVMKNARTLDQPDRMPPDIHIFTMSKQPWVVLPAGARVRYLRL